MKYKINEIFYSLQGEGFHSGCPVSFVRFSGCNLKCSFCDTQHSQYVLLTKENIFDIVKKENKSNVVVFTGGEPLLQVDYDLVSFFKSKNFMIHLETNGTIDSGLSFDWVTCSPKKESELRLKYFDEIKVLWYSKDFVEKFSSLNVNNKFIQPISGENITQIIKYIKENCEWRLSTQLQKILKIK